MIDIILQGQYSLKKKTTTTKFPYAFGVMCLVPSLYQIYYGLIYNSIG